MRKSIDTYLKSIMHDNEDYIRENYYSLGEYIIINAVTKTGWRKYFDDSELNETGEPNKEQVGELIKYLYQKYNSKFENFEVWYRSPTSFVFLKEFRTLKQAQEYCMNEVDVLEYCGAGPADEGCDTSHRLEVYEGIPTEYNENGYIVEEHEPIYNTEYYFNRDK